MAWWIKVLELANEKGLPTGKYCLTATSDENGGGSYGLCQHAHNSPKEAQNCPEARERAKTYG